MTEPGRVEALWTKHFRREPMHAVRRATAVTGKGIDGDAAFGRGRRQVTVVEREVFEKVREKLPEAVPEMRRANVMVGGVRLAESVGGLLALGEVRIRVLGETKPCARMDEACPGLREALGPDWGGGVYGRVERGGEVVVGAEASWTPE